MQVGKVIIDTNKSFFTVDVLILYPALRPAPTEEQAFIIPVLALRPEREHIRIVIDDEKSEDVAIFLSVLTILLPKASTIRLPPHIVPAIIVSATQIEI